MAFTFVVILWGGKNLFKKSNTPVSDNWIRTILPGPQAWGRYFSLAGLQCTPLPISFYYHLISGFPKGEVAVGQGWPMGGWVAGLWIHSFEYGSGSRRKNEWKVGGGIWLKGGGGVDSGAEVKSDSSWSSAPESWIYPPPFSMVPF